MLPRFKKSLSLVLLSLAALEANATQAIHGAEDRHVQVTISAHETNRLAVSGRRISHVVPSVKGIISTQKDEALGALYFTLSNPSSRHGTVTLFVSDDQGVTYKLLLVPRQVAGEEIIVHPPSEKSPDVSEQPRTDADGRALSYQRRIKTLILSMADSSYQEAGLMPRRLHQEIPLWKEARLVLSAVYRDADLLGEHYRLTNVSSTDMLLVEQELYRRGVRAVSIEHHTLAPGDSTDVYIVRERRGHE